MSGALEFELTDFETARAAHDVVPPGVGTVTHHTAQDWDSRRLKPVPTDRALTGATIAWVLGLPPSLRPKRLCDRFPRIANALATAWPDAEARVTLLDGLLTDQRRRRAGFPADVRIEIERLSRA